MRSRFPSTLLIVLLVVTSATAADYRVEVLNEAPPADELSAKIVSQLNSTGIKVIRDTSRTVCEIWPCQQWPVKGDFQASRQVLYPFQPGQLIGVLRFPRRGSDLRDQPISRGVYTLRYDQQPVDGNHQGTFPTRDFLLLVHAEADVSADPMDPEKLSELSAEAAESTHPATLALEKVQGEGADIPSIRHDEGRDFWIVRFAGKVKSGDQVKPIAVELVVAGVAEE